MSHSERTSEIVKPQGNAIDKLKQAVTECKQAGRRVLAVELSGEKPLLATTETLRELPTALGDALTVVVNALAKSSQGQFTKEQIFDSVMSLVVARAETNLKITREEDSDTDSNSEPGSA
jgi:hypothetical protein